MVIGNGLVAKKFTEKYLQNNDVVIYASGVSNSKCVDDREYNRESYLVENTIKNNPQKCFVYFSTCSVYDEAEINSKYVLHKKNIESFIEKYCANYFIFRVSNLVGKSNNNNTVLNFFYDKIKNNLPFNLWANTNRNLIDIDDMYKLVDFCISNNYRRNEITNIANAINFSVKKIVETLELHLNKKATFVEVEKGETGSINIMTLQPYFNELDIHFDNNYLHNLLKKYYSC